MKKTLILMALCSLSIIAFAQEGKIPNWKNEVGLHAGFTTGAGLSYRHWFSRAGIQLTALPIKTNTFNFMSVGGSFLYTFKEFEYSRFYGYVGGHYLESGSGANNGVRNKINMGLGPALAFGKQIRFNIMAGYGIYNLTGEIATYPTGEIGLYYNF